MKAVGLEMAVKGNIKVIKNTASQFLHVDIKVNKITETISLFLKIILM